MNLNGGNRFKLYKSKYQLKKCAPKFKLFRAAVKARLLTVASISVYISHGASMRIPENVNNLLVYHGFSVFVSPLLFCDLFLFFNIFDKSTIKIKQNIDFIQK